MRRGDICWYVFGPPDKRRPVLLLTRDSAIPMLNAVTIAPITSTVRDIPTEVMLTREDGMPASCAVNFDNVQTVSKRKLGERITRLRPDRLAEVARALSFALALDE